MSLLYRDGYDGFGLELGSSQGHPDTTAGQHAQYIYHHEQYYSRYVSTFFVLHHPPISGPEYKHVLDLSTDADPTRNARLRGTANKTTSNKTPQSPATDDVHHHHMPSPSNNSISSQSSASLSSKLPPLPASPSLSQSIGMMGTGEEALNAYHLPRPLPLWLNPTAAKHIVKGNFMTLSARPKTVEQGEWIAHQGNS